MITAQLRCCRVPLVGLRDWRKTWTGSERGRSAARFYVRRRQQKLPDRKVRDRRRSYRSRVSPGQKYFVYRRERARVGRSGPVSPSQLQGDPAERWVVGTGLPCFELNDGRAAGFGPAVFWLKAKRDHGLSVAVMRRR